MPTEDEKPDFPLNKPAWRDAKIVVAGRNFGCGSSREAAVYALYDYGIRCVIAPSFGDIFAGNAVQNGLLTAAVTDDEAAEIDGVIGTNAGFAGHRRSGTAEHRVRQPDVSTSSIDPVRRMRLLNGWDDIDLTESYRAQIAAFRTKDKAERAWSAPAGGG